MALMKTHLDRTLSGSPVFQAWEITVAVALPLERWHFFLERHVQSSLLKALGLSRDFVRNGLRDDWKKWWTEELAPAVDALHAVDRVYGVSVIRHATLANLQSAAGDGRTRLLFLIAHHPAETGDIELYEGLVPWGHVAAAVSDLSVVLMVCGSGNWMNDLLDMRQLPAGSVLPEMPVREGCIYLRFLLERLVGGAPLDEAQHDARRNFLGR
jgi:hypothetical protein